MPRKFNLPLTYAPKIEGVRNGTIRQTIRTGRRFAVGDHVSFHGWLGRPYFSKWSFRTEYFRLTQVWDIFIEKGGIRWAEHAAQLARLSQRIRDEEAAERHADEIKGVQG